MVKKTFSTIEVARLLGSSVKSVQRWIDQEQLGAGRTPGGHRRIGIDDLIAFVKKQNLPVSDLLTLSVPQVLVVDDDPRVTKWIKGEIKARHPDWGVAEAHDGFTTGRMFEVMRPDVVILDLRMSQMNGFEVCRKIDNMESAKGISVIAIAAKHSPSIKKAILACGARASLSKPLDAEVLMSEIEGALS